MRFVIAGSFSRDPAESGLYRSLVAALMARGHAISFLEREANDSAAAEEIDPPFGCDLRRYRGLDELDAMRPDLAKADVVVLGSGLADAKDLAAFLRDVSLGMTAFLDFDTPATAGSDGYGDEIARGFDLYLSSSGGLVPRRVEDRLGLPARAFTAWVDAAACEKFVSDDDDQTDDAPAEVLSEGETAAPVEKYDLGFVGDYREDRQPALERLLCAAARRMPKRRFVVAGAGYPATIRWPANVDRAEVVPDNERAAFLANLDWALALSTPAQAAAGFSPGAGLIEALARGPAVIATPWRGLSSMFVQGTDLLTATETSEVVAALSRPAPIRDAMAHAGRARVRMGFTAAHRAAALESAIAAWAAPAKRRAARAAFQAKIAETIGRRA